MIKYLTMLILILVSVASFAKANKENTRLTVAVMHYSVNGCSESIGFAMTDMLSSDLFKADYFILLEREKIDMALREEALPGGSNAESRNIAKIGKKLAVDKIIAGSVSRIGNKFRIETRVIDVSLGTIDLTLTRKSQSESGIEEAALYIARDIERHYRGYGKLTGFCDLSFTASALFGISDFARGAQFGYGCRLNWYINTPFHLPIQIIISPGFFTFVPTLNSIEWMMYMPIELHVSYPVRLSRNLFLIPSVGGGYILSWVSYDSVEDRTTSYRYSTEFYYNPLLSLRLELDVLFYDRWYLVITPSYTAFFETERTGHIIEVSLGFKVKF